MAQKVERHYQKDHARIIVVETGNNDGDGKAITMSFAWGLDVPLEIVRKEIKALMADAGEKPEVNLPGLGVIL